jgi:hypothetical protein
MVRMLPNLREWAQRYHRKSQEEVGPLADFAAGTEAAARFRSALDALGTALAQEEIA